MSRITLVAWDVDKVWYPGISTSYCADGLPEELARDVSPYVEQGLRDGWLTKEDHRNWAEYSKKDPGNPFETRSDYAKCLTDFLYSIKRADGNHLPKQQVIDGKQALLGGLTMNDMKYIADRVEKTSGLKVSIKNFDKNGLSQGAFSDGFGPFITYTVRKINALCYCSGIKSIGVVPAIIERDGIAGYFYEHMLHRDDYTFTGRLEKFDKSLAFFGWVIGGGHSLDEVAAIDDSAANIPTLKKIHEAGGVAIAFNPTEAHDKEFREAGIPILKQEEGSLEPFMEIVLDPRESVIGKYCI